MNKCERCGNYKAYYTQGYCRFEKEPCGFCTEQQKVVQQNDVCEKWRSDYYAKKLRQQATTQAIRDLLPKFAAALQISVENPEDDESID